MPSNFSTSGAVVSKLTTFAPFNTKRFVGQEEREIATLMEFAQQEAPGYTLVEALAGYGKTAVFARWFGFMKLPPGREFAGLAYFFVRKYGPGNTAAAFLRAVNTQMLDAVVEERIPEDVPKLRISFSRLWSRVLQAANRERPFLLFGRQPGRNGSTSSCHRAPSSGQTGAIRSCHCVRAMNADIFQHVRV